MRAPLDYIIMAAFGVGNFVLSFVGYWWPPDKVFDEIYFARAGEEYLQNLRIYENTHPPLSKLLVMFSMMLFGGMPHGHGLGGWNGLNAHRRPHAQRRQLVRLALPRRRLRRAGRDAAVRLCQARYRLDALRHDHGAASDASTACTSCSRASRRPKASSSSLRRSRSTRSIASGSVRRSASARTSTFRVGLRGWCRRARWPPAGPSPSLGAARVRLRHRVDGRSSRCTSPAGSICSCATFSFRAASATVGASCRSAKARTRCATPPGDDALRRRRRHDRRARQDSARRNFAGQGRHARLRRRPADDRVPPRRERELRNARRRRDLRRRRDSRRAGQRRSRAGARRGFG